MGNTGVDRRSEKPGSGGLISITGSNLQHSQAGFFDRPWLVLAAVAGGVAIGVGVMLFTDSSRFAHKEQAHAAGIPSGQPTSDGINVEVKPEAETPK